MAVKRESVGVKFARTEAKSIGGALERYVALALESGTDVATVRRYLALVRQTAFSFRPCGGREG